MATVQTRTGARDFDFFHGSWRILNERLTSRLTNCDEWERFEAFGDCRPILGGLGNIDDFRPTWRGREGFEGASLRLFNPATEQWSIYWMDTIGGELLPPVMGRFSDGVGVFYGDDRHEGTPVLVRFRWSDITPNSARWEQAFSTDRGETWEINWVMTLSRIQAD